MASDAVGSERISKVVGYKIAKGTSGNTTPNLPQRVAILGEANHANQSTLDTAATVITSAQEAGEKYGFGSPIYHIMRILRPNGGGGIGGIPTVVYAQEAAVGAAYKVIDVTPTGTATGNGTHTVKIAGRSGVDGSSYDINIETGDTASDITEKMADVVNNVLGAPVTASDYVTSKVTLTSKWKGLTADEITVSVDTNDDDLGITYSVVSTQSGSGTPSIAAALALFGNEWNTLVVNSYGTQEDIMDALEAFNGIPDPSTPTGRYAAIVMKPFVAITGSVAEDPSSITDTRLDDVTIAIAPAPLSDGLHFEAAACMTLLQARVAQDTPNLDVSGKSYTDMPTPLIIGDMADYENRDVIVKKGCSTVDLVGGRYKIMDFVTTYHPVGEIPPQFRWVRNLNIDWNIRFGYYLLELVNVADHSISGDDDIVNAASVIKPKQWRQILNKYAEDLSKKAIIVDAPFMQDSITVEISTVNPDRLETHFSYKRSGFARILSTTAEANFNIGTL